MSDTQPTTPMHRLKRIIACTLLAVGLTNGTAHAAADCGAYPGTEWATLCPQGVPLFVCASENGEPDNWHFVGCWAY